MELHQVSVLVFNQMHFNAVENRNVYKNCIAYDNKSFLSWTAIVLFFI